MMRILRSGVLRYGGLLAVAWACDPTNSAGSDEPQTITGLDADVIGQPPGEGGGGSLTPLDPIGQGANDGTGPGPGAAGAGGEGMMMGGGAAGGEGGRDPYCQEGIEDICGDDFDNNCNGRVDEGCNCTSPEKPCYTGDPLDLEVENGQCRQGLQACDGEFYGDCVGEVKPGAEVCDGLDNDCDNVTDDLNDCNNTPPVAICPPDQMGPTLANYDFEGGYVDDDGDAMASAVWTILEKPAGSTAAPTPADELNTSIFADLQGSYTLELTVTDVRGGVGRCETHLTTGSDDGLRIEMVWNSGAREDRSDVDMHLKKSPVGRWFDFADDGDDCFYANCRVCDADYSIGDEEVEIECREQIAEINNDPNREPEPQVEWTPPLDADDPRLDLDDVEGGGPENINIRTPSNGTFRLGVHYYDDDGFGPSTVSLRVFCANRVAAEIGPVVLEPHGLTGEDPASEFWEVGDIEWRGADCEFRAFGSQQCPQICGRGEVTTLGGCVPGLTRGQPCR